MTIGAQPKLHHYVPQFYLRRFADAKGRFWVWDKTNDRVFQSTSASIAAESDFYRLREFEKLGRDPYILEKQLADMEGQTAAVTGQWLTWLRAMEPGQKIPIPKANRYIVARFMAVQFLRTVDTREILSLLATDDGSEMPSKKGGDLHAELLWDQRLIRRITNHIRDAVWIFARNTTDTPFITSDNPMAFRTKDNRMWLKMGFVSEGTYGVYPLAPDLIMFSHERKFWKKIRQFDRSLSAAPMTSEMVESENSGQVFMASRFLVSSKNDFEHARAFALSIGTDLYAAAEHRGKTPNEVLLGSGSEPELAPKR